MKTNFKCPYCKIELGVSCEAQINHMRDHLKAVHRTNQPFGHIATRICSSNNPTSISPRLGNGSNNQREPIKEKTS